MKIVLTSTEISTGCIDNCYGTEKDLIKRQRLVDSKYYGDLAKLWHEKIDENYYSFCCYIETEDLQSAIDYLMDLKCCTNRLIISKPKGEYLPNFIKEGCSYIIEIYNDYRE